PSRFLHQLAAAIDLGQPLHDRAEGLVAPNDERGAVECMEGHRGASVWCVWSELLQWSPAQEQPLLPRIGEPHRCFRFVTMTLDVDDDAVAPLRVAHVVADPQAERVGP